MAVDLLRTLDRSQILRLKRNGYTVTSTTVTATDNQLVYVLHRFLVSLLTRRGQRG